MINLNALKNRLIFAIHCLEIKESRDNLWKAAGGKKAKPQNQSRRGNKRNSVNQLLGLMSLLITGNK